MINLFFSYSHKDQILRDELDKHLSVLKRQKIIDAWHDRRISAGSDFSSDISSHLNNANIILLLISADFLASDYCYDLEMKIALEKHESKQSVVIPVILRACDWHDAPFGKLMAIPKNGKPVVAFERVDDAFFEITTEIKRVVRMISSGTGPVSTPSSKSHKANIEPQSSDNFRIPKTFSANEKDSFLDEAFEHIVNHFSGSLAELKRNNYHVDYREKRLDLQTAHYYVYVNGEKKAECMIYFRLGIGSLKTICYSNKISSELNRFNESISVTENGYDLSLKTFGLSTFKQKKESLSLDEAAKYYWEMFIQPLQQNAI